MHAAQLVLPIPVNMNIYQDIVSFTEVNIEKKIMEKIKMNKIWLINEFKK